MLYVEHGVFQFESRHESVTLWPKVIPAPNLTSKCMFGEQMSGTGLSRLCFISKYTTGIGELPSKALSKNESKFLKTRKG